jgi:Leucine-rich repeat (LRR) protein
MISADCYGLDLTEIPQNLRTDIELLQATHNRIRELDSKSFNRYPYLRVLYLDDNMISYIENGTFDSLQNLEVIRLSQNALDRVPTGVLQLPNIRKIFVDNNRFVRGGGLVGAPTRDTVVSLTLAQCHLEELPPLEMFPNLLELNVSANNLKTIRPKQLASLCQLQFLDISRNPKLSQDINGDGCACHLLASWIEDKNINLQRDNSLNCTKKVLDFAHCGNMSEAEEIYSACMSSVIAKAEAIQARNTWILVGCILGSVIATGALILFCCRRNKRKKQKKDKGTNNNIDDKRKSQIEEDETKTTDTLLEGKNS